jgi:hypothetical protein
MIRKPGTKGNKIKFKRALASGRNSEEKEKVYKAARKEKDASCRADKS